MKEQIVDLNVGGTFVSTCRSTLCLLEGSKLSQMFDSEEHFRSLLRDSQGRIFLDYDPEVFLPIVNYLRRRKICGKTESPTVPEGKRSGFDELVVSLGLQAYLWPHANVFHVTLKSHHISLTHDMKCAIGKGSSIGSMKFSNAVVYSRFRVEHLENAESTCPVYLGVVMHQEIAYLGPVNMKNSHKDKKDANYICSPSGAVVALFGKTAFTMNHFLPGLFLDTPQFTEPPKAYKSSTEINVTLCCKKDENYVQCMDLSDEHKTVQTIDLPPGAYWRFFAVSADPAVKITFVDCTRLTELAPQDVSK
eukprot:TRINITY_DN26475_c0_g1_i1.p2 TRINITY_DN26475_c0_g1~~TRINITY_DN26475_c0_g1_i1.p2  ORF type:complete len:306 (-),score=50.62 TRINITY_DN26475_c0_g1_i1:167-1084(-)